MCFRTQKVIFRWFKLVYEFNLHIVGVKKITQIFDRNLSYNYIILLINIACQWSKFLLNMCIKIFYINSTI